MKLANDGIWCVIVDDHALLLDLLVGAISGTPGLMVTATAKVLLAEIARVFAVPRPAHDDVLASERIRSHLTARERRVFVALGDGLANKEIGNRLDISTRTVETHRQAIARKMGVNGAALVRLSVIQGRGGRDAVARRQSTVRGPDRVRSDP